MKETVTKLTCDFCHKTSESPKGWRHYAVGCEVVGGLKWSDFDICSECLGNMPDQSTRGFLKRLLFRTSK